MRRRRGDREQRVAPTGSVGSGAGNLFISRLIVAIAGWTGTIVIARELTPSGWGAYSLVFGILGIVGLVVDLQIGRIVLRQVLAAGDDAGPLIGSYVLLRTLISVAAFVVAVVVVIAGGYEDRIVAATIVAALAYFFASPANGLIIWFHARLWLRPVAIANAVGAVLQLAVVVGLATGTRGSLLQFAAASLVSQVVILTWQARVFVRHHLRITFRVDPRQWWTWSKEAVPLTIGLALATLYYKIDIVLLGQLDTLKSIGQYGIGYKFADLTVSLSYTFLLPLMTVMVAAWPHDLPALREHFRQAVVVLALAGTALGVGFALVAGPLTESLYGARYSPSVFAARFLMAGAVVQFFSQLCSVTLVAVGRNRPYALAGLVGVVVNTILNVMLIPTYSFRGSAVATVITEVFVLAVLVGALLRTRGVVTVPARVLLHIALAGAAMAGSYLAVDAVLPWPVAGVAGGLLFLAVLHVLGAEEPGGLRAFARTVRFDTRVEPALVEQGIDGPA